MDKMGVGRGMVGSELSICEQSWEVWWKLLKGEGSRRVSNNSGTTKRVNHQEKNCRGHTQSDITPLAYDSLIDLSGIIYTQLLLVQPKAEDWSV